MLGHSGPPWQSRAGGSRLGSGQLGDASSPAESGIATRLLRGELAFYNLRQLDDKVDYLVLEDRRPQHGHGRSAVEQRDGGSDLLLAAPSSSAMRGLIGFIEPEQ